MSDRIGLDPISQLLGALTAQQATMTAQLSELRADVLQNRLKAEEHREREIHAWESVEAELRNVKHEDRAFQQKMIAFEARMEKIEGQLTAWQARLGMVTAAAAPVGGIVGIVIEIVVRAVFARWFPG